MSHTYSSIGPDSPFLQKRAFLFCIYIFPRFPLFSFKTLFRNKKFPENKCISLPSLSCSKIKQQTASKTKMLKKYFDKQQTNFNSLIFCFVFEKVFREHHKYINLLKDYMPTQVYKQQ